MKRIAVVVLAAAVVAGQAFALDVTDELKIKGAVETGVQIQGGSNEAGKTQDAVYKLYNDADETPLRGQVEALYEGEKGGARVVLRSDAAYAGDELRHVFQLPVAFGWYKLFDDKVEVSGGLLENGKWGTFTDFNYKWGTDLDSDNLIKIEIKPIEGLSFGINTFDFRKYTTDWQLFGKKTDNGPRQQNPDPADKDKKIDPKEHNPFSDTVFGVKYVQEDAFGIAAEFVTYSTDFGGVWANNLTSASKNLILGGQGKLIDLLNPDGATAFGGLLSFQLKSIENLQIDADAHFALFTPAEKTTTTLLGIAAQGMYGINDQLKVGAKVAFGLGDQTVDKNGAGVWDLVITPKGSYEVNDWLKLGLEIPVGLVQNLYGTGDAKDNPNQNKDTFKDWKGGFSVGVKPKATFTLQDGISFVAWYRLDVLSRGYNDKSSVFLPDTKPENADIGHTIQLDFIWSF